MPVESSSTPVKRINTRSAGGKEGGGGHGVKKGKTSATGKKSDKPVHNPAKGQNRQPRRAVPPDDGEKLMNLLLSYLKEKRKRGFMSLSFQNIKEGMGLSDKPKDLNNLRKALNRLVGRRILGYQKGPEMFLLHNAALAHDTAIY
jgi:hypothetical protein